MNFDEIVIDKRWRKYIEEEIYSTEKKNTWELTMLSEDHQEIGVKQVNKTKKNAHGEVERYKAILVAKGYKQRNGIDLEDVYAPVSSMHMIYALISLVA